MLVGQGVAGQIEICLLQDPRAAPLHQKLVTDLTPVARAGIVCTAFVFILGILVRNGYLPSLPMAVIINALAMVPALGFMAVTNAFIRSLEGVLDDAMVALSKRQAHLGFWMPASVAANRVGVMFFLWMALWMNKPLFVAEGRLPINPYIGFLLMAVLYVGAAWHVYMDRLVRATKQHALLREK